MALATIPAFASSSVVRGTFTQDDNVALFSFSISAGDLVTLQSYGYAGGVAPGDVVIPGGGFAPNLVLFDNTGMFIASDNGGHCAITGADAVTGNCDDPYLQESLAAGAYTLALVEWDNTAIDTLSDGFKQDGNPGFTCAEFGTDGNFCDVTTAVGTRRSGDYALTISAADLVAAATPEPASFALFCSASLIALLRRGTRKSA